MTRRQLLVAGGAWLAAGALDRGGRPALARATDDGTPIVQQHASSVDDPWALAHGLRAMGRDFTVKGGRRAADHLLEHVLTTVPAGAGTALAFPREVEAHPNMFLKTILEAGVPLDHAFTHKGRRRTLGDVVDGARTLLRPRVVAPVPNALPWSVIALTRTTPTLRRQWTNGWGEAVDLDALVERALLHLESASAPLAQAMQEHRPIAAQAPVHGFTCGGTHMIYALLSAASAGYTGKDRRARLQRQVDVLVWRLGADLEMMERFYRARAGHAAAAWYELDAKLKLLGHAEECLAVATSHDVATLTSVQREQWRSATAALKRLLADLQRRELADAKAIDRELYRQLVGDVCHARHGLTLS